MLRHSDFLDYGRPRAASYSGLFCPPKPPDWTTPASDVVRALSSLLRRDVRGLLGLPAAFARAGPAHRHAAGPHLHRAARLRPWLVLRLPARQSAGRPAVQPGHADAVRLLGSPARPAPRQLEQPRAQRRQRHLFGLPDGARISRAVALAPPALSPAAPSVGRQHRAAAADHSAAVSRAVRHAARLGARALVGVPHRRSPWRLCSARWSR